MNLIGETSAEIRDAAGDAGRNRPDKMQMVFMSNIIRTLGADMYSNLGKVLVEFIANAYDSDAKTVDITIDFDKIAAERDRLREAAKSSLASAGPEKAIAVEPPSGGGDAIQNSGSTHASDMIADFDVMQQILPDEFVITIEDDGHGMSWEDIRNKFLSVNRQRRKVKGSSKENLRSPGNRLVMGRKGVGKLAGFGAALVVTVRSTIEGQDFATQAVIDTSGTSDEQSIAKLDIPVSYIPVDRAETGTTITLSRLRAEALKERPATIEHTIAQRFFGLRVDDFAIRINDKVLKPVIPDYAFVFPESLSVEAISKGEMETANFSVEGIGVYAFRYYVGFRKQSLRGSERGARIYCHNRLAAGPSLFGMKTGMHNFYGTDYMECMVEADVLDKGSIDLVSTNRGELKEGNEVVEAFLDRVREVMEDAIRAHGKWRETKAVNDLANDPVASAIAKQIEFLPSKTREPSRKLLQIFARDYDVGSPEFLDLAPTLLRSINSSEVILKLSATGVSLKTIADLTVQLRELADIERWDSLKLYKARKAGILRLIELHERSIENWKQHQNEKEFHQLLKENPWLVRPEFSHYIASNARMNTVATRIAKVLKVDEFAAVKDGVADDDRRPDLVFLASEPSIDGPFVMKIIELKAPTKGLRIADWRQLEDYLSAARNWCKTNLSHPVALQGILIGAMPLPNTSVAEEISLLEKFHDTTPKDQIRIIGMTELIRDAKVAHLDAIDAIEAELAFDDAEQFDAPIPKLTVVS